MILLLMVFNVVFWQMFLGCGKFRRWRQKRKGSKKKLNSKPSAIPVTPHPQFKSNEEIKPDQIPMRTRTLETPETASARIAAQNNKKINAVPPLGTPEDQVSQGQQEEPAAAAVEKPPEVVVQPTAPSVPQAQQQTKENSQETKDNMQKEEESKNVEKKAAVKRNPPKDARAELRKRSVPCKTGKEADKLLDTSVQRMSPENTLRDVPRTMPEFSVNYGSVEMDPTFQDSQLL